MITITISNPSEHSAVELRLLGDYLYNCAHEKDAPIAAAGPKLADVLSDTFNSPESVATEMSRSEPPVVITKTAEQVAFDKLRQRDHEHRQEYAARRSAPHFTIDPTDHPDTGAPTIEPLVATQDDADDAPTATPEPTTVFGHGTVGAFVPLTADAPEPSDDIDSAGVVWNPDLHSRTKSKNADGTWRAKRGVAKDAPTVPEAEPIPAPWPFTPPAGIVAPAPAIAVPPVPVAPPAPPVADVPPAPPAPNIVSFPALMQKISPAVASGKVTQEQVVAIVTRLGVPSLPLLSTRPDLIPTVSAEIDALL
jgi:hypothetical protein